MEGASLYEVEKLALKKLKIYKRSKFRFLCVPLSPACLLDLE